MTGIQETGTRINEQPLVKLDLQISGPGLTPFASQDRVIASIARLPMTMNRKLVAMVDPTTNEYQIDWERGGLVSGGMPANFTIAEDNRNGSRIWMRGSSPTPRPVSATTSGSTRRSGTGHPPAPVIPRTGCSSRRR